MIQTSLRCSKEPGVVILSMNKTDPMGWIKTQLWDEATERNAATLECGIDENIHLSPEIVDEYKSTYYGHFKKRFIDNEWASASGTVYEAWELDDADYGAEATLSLDWGPAGVTAGLFWVKTPYGYQIAGELYYDGRQAGRVTDQTQVANLMAKGYEFKTAIVDPSAVPMQDALRAAGVRVIGGNNAIEKGIITTDFNLRTGKVKINPACKSLLAEMSAYAWSTNPGDDKPIKRNDHACDALRYGMMQLMPMRSRQPEKLRGF